MGIIEAIGAVIAAIATAFWFGRRQGAAKRDAKHGEDYIAERKRQDEMDVGHGASDADRIRMLEHIRDRNGKRKN